MKSTIRETHEAMGTEWWDYAPALADTVQSAVSPIFLANDIKRASVELLPDLSEIRIHHLVACVLRGSGFPAQAVVGRERTTDIVSPAYRSWVEIEGVGVVTTASDVDLLCNELVRLPYDKSFSE